MDITENIERYVRFFGGPLDGHVKLVPNLPAVYRHENPVDYTEGEPLVRTTEYTLQWIKSFDGRCVSCVYFYTKHDLVVSQVLGEFFRKAWFDTDERKCKAT